MKRNDLVDHYLMKTINEIPTPDKDYFLVSWNKEKDKHRDSENLVVYPISKTEWAWIYDDDDF